MSLAVNPISAAACDWNNETQLVDLAANPSVAACDWIIETQMLDLSDNPSAGS